ncbi:547_t:CDS:2, partial [Gigaspora margarita]
NLSSSFSNKSISLNMTEAYESQDDEDYSELFKNWEDLVEWFNNHGLENEFAFIIIHSEKDKGNRIPSTSQPYIPQKEAHVINDNDSSHNTIGTFNVNAYQHKSESNNSKNNSEENSKNNSKDNPENNSKNNSKETSIKQKYRMCYTLLI